MGQVKPTDDYYSAILARLVRVISVAKFVQYGLIAAFMSVVIVGLLSLRVH